MTRVAASSTLHPQSRPWLFSSLVCFAQWTKKKERLLIVRSLCLASSCYFCFLPPFLIVTVGLVQVIHVSWIEFSELSFLSNVTWINSKWYGYLYLDLVGCSSNLAQLGITGDDWHWFICRTLHEPNQVHKLLKYSPQKCAFFPFEFSLTAGCKES